MLAMYKANAAVLTISMLKFTAGVPPFKLK
jgi:hypothetical protein